ncbi:unnamed protein product, partial [Prorocentrum cordatum]
RGAHGVPPPHGGLVSAVGAVDPGGARVGHTAGPAAARAAALSPRGGPPRDHRAAQGPRLPGLRHAGG